MTTAVDDAACIVGIGVDLVETARLAKAIERHGDRFLRRIFTSGELAYCNGRLGPLAARFAAKEAVAKAFGTGIGEAMTFLDIEVARCPSGQPVVILNGSAQRTAKSRHVHEVLLSLSHTENFAVAQVVLTACREPMRPPHSHRSLEGPR